jgi:uncharacterized membrane protein YebE (DUF533 family)
MERKTKTIILVAGVVLVAFIGYRMYTKNKRVADLNPNNITTRPGAFADKPKSETMAQTISKAV